VSILPEWEKSGAMLAPGSENDRADRSGDVSWWSRPLVVGVLMALLCLVGFCSAEAFG